MAPTGMRGSSHSCGRGKAAGLQEFVEGMVKDYRAAPKRYWKTFCHLCRGIRGTI